MNKWGIPDWTDPATYGEVARWSAVRWRWEFTRRKPKYRANAISFFNIIKKRNAAVAHFRCTRTDEARERLKKVADWQEFAFNAFWRRWGYTEVLDPRISEYTDDILKILCPDSFNVMVGSKSSEIGRSVMLLKTGEVAIRFKLDKPLAEQIKGATNKLNRLQKEFHGKQVREPEHREKWLDYLRALDAREAGASLSQIAMILPPRLGRKDAQAAANMLDQARAVQLRF